VSKMDKCKAPEKKFRAGSVTVSLWKNAVAGSKFGDSNAVDQKVVDQKSGNSGYYTISMERSYKDKNGNWQNSGSLRVNDLPKAALVLNRAYEFLVLKESQEDIGSLY
jgi:hypothetical protein